MYDNNAYGSVITEQGDLGLGVTPIHEDAHNRKKNEHNNDGEQNKQHTSK